MEPVFAHADWIFKAINRFVKRPRKGELPSEVPGRSGLPVLSLIGDEQEKFVDQIAQAISAAEPRRVPHEVIDVQAMLDEVREQRGSESSPNYLPLEWQQTELCRRILVKLAAEYSSARNGREQRVRFRRFGLVNWLLEMTYTAEEPNSQHAQQVLRRLRARELERRPLFGFMRNPETEVALEGFVPWWAYLLGLHVLPLLWFRAWRALGSEYRWLLRQPYMAPGDPGTFEGFALRLTQPRWGREDPVQITKLMVNAFLEDLRVAYRRRPWRRRAYRRTAYCVALLKGVSTLNDGWTLVRTLAEVRNETGAFDPLLMVTSSRDGESEPSSRAVLELADGLDPYDVWCESLRTRGRVRTAEFWYLQVRAPAPLPTGHPNRDAQVTRNSMAARITVPRPPRGTGPLSTVGVFLVILAVVATILVNHLSDERRWEEAHCGLSRSNPDAETLRRQSTGECVGVAPHGHAFGSDDELVRKTLKTIARHNAEAERIHRDAPSRRMVTLVHLSALLSSPPGKASDTLSYMREQLQGAASAQRRQLDRRGEHDPVLRIFPASAGSGMRHGVVTVKLIEQMMRTDSTIVGVSGLDQSRKDTITTISELTRVGLPMVATTLSADTLDDHSPLYYQVSPQNRREAAVAVAYVTHLVENKTLKNRNVQVVYSADPNDEYSRNLRDDAVVSFRQADFEIEERSYRPRPASSESSGHPGAWTIGERVCDYQGLVFFAGRSEDFETLLSAANATCGSSAPAFLAGDDVARLAADPNRRGGYPRLTYEFLDFTLGSASCDGPSDLYSTMKELFPKECKNVPSTSLDGHAALAFDAVNLYLKAVGHLQDTAPHLPLTAPAVWQALSRIHGDAALAGESGDIDFGGVVDQQIPLDKLISIQRVEGEKRPKQVGFCGLIGKLEQSEWCPELESRQPQYR